MAKDTKPTLSLHPTQDELRLRNYKSQEQKTLDKLERIKTWPKEHQAAATQRAQAKLNQIREDMKTVDKPAISPPA